MVTADLLPAGGKRAGENGQAQQPQQPQLPQLPQQPQQPQQPQPQQPQQRQWEYPGEDYGSRALPGAPIRSALPVQPGCLHQCHWEAARMLDRAF